MRAFGVAVRMICARFQTPKRDGWAGSCYALGSHAPVLELQNDLEKVFQLMVVEAVDHSLFKSQFLILHCRVGIFLPFRLAMATKNVGGEDNFRQPW